MKTIIIIIVAAFVFTSCGTANTSRMANAAPLINKKIHEITKDALPIEEELMEEFRNDLDEIVSRTGLKTESMEHQEITKAARYLGYNGQIGEAIKLYEEALQDTGFQKRIAFHHNLGRLYEEIGEDDLAIGRYQYLVNFGHRNYQKDIDRVTERTK